MTRRCFEFELHVFCVVSHDNSLKETKKRLILSEACSKTFIVSFSSKEHNKCLSE